MARRAKQHRRPGVRNTTKISNGKRTYYVNLAVFNKTCKTTAGGRACELRNLRCEKRGGGLATVDAYRNSPSQGGSYKDTWLLQFADCSVLKQHLRKRVTDPKALLRR